MKSIPKMMTKQIAKKAPKKVPEVEVEKISKVLVSNKVSPKNTNRIQICFKADGKLHYVSIACNKPSIIQAMTQLMNGGGLTEQQSEAMSSFEGKCFDLLKRKYGFELNTTEAHVFWGHLE